MKIPNKIYQKFVSNQVLTLLIFFYRGIFAIKASAKAKKIQRRHPSSNTRPHTSAACEFSSAPLFCPYIYGLNMIPINSHLVNWSVGKAKKEQTKSQKRAKTAIRSTKGYAADLAHIRQTKS